MRAAESYRSAKRAKRIADKRARRAIRPGSAGPERVDGLWAAQGGTLTPGQSAAIQAQARAALSEAKKLTVADIDAALEAALTKHQLDRNGAPLPLPPLLAARARSLNWVEEVEFIEEKSFV